jgi:hypothetical protein
MQIESPPLHNEHTDRDVDADLDADRVHWRSGTSRRAPSFKSDQFRSAQSALTATLVARMPIVLFFMARSPLDVLNLQYACTREHRTEVTYL